MIKKQTQEVIQEVVVGKICDVCGAESATVNGWKRDDSEDLRLISFVDTSFGASMYRQADMCPTCFNKVVDFLYSIGGKLVDLE